MDLTFKITAVILAGIAAYFLWRGNVESAFVTGVFAAVAFFLSVRFQVHERMKQRGGEREEREKGEKGKREKGEEGEEGNSELALAESGGVSGSEKINNVPPAADDRQKI